MRTVATELRLIGIRRTFCETRSRAVTEVLTDPKVVTVCSVLIALLTMLLGGETERALLPVCIELRAVLAGEPKREFVPVLAKLLGHR